MAWRWSTGPEVAKHLHIHPGTLSALCRKGLGPPFRWKGNRRLFDIQEANLWWEIHKTEKHLRWLRGELEKLGKA